MKAFIALFVFLTLAVLIPGGNAQSGPTDDSSGPDAHSIIDFLNQTILWYRQLSTEQELADHPSDVVFLNDNRQVADQVVRLSFEFARSEAQLLAAPSGSAGSASSQSSASTDSSRYKTLAALAAKSDEQLKRSQAEIESLKAQLETTTGRKHRTLEMTLAETQSEYQLWQARRDTFHSMLDFASSTNAGGVGAGSLQSQIEELARTIPALAAESTKPGAESGASATAANPATTPKSEPSGILAILSDLIGLRRKLNTFDQISAATDALALSSQSLRRPLVNSVKEMTRQGDQLANQPDSQDPAAIAQQKRQIDQLTANFKQISGTVVPLGKQSILLNLYKRNLANWRSSVKSQYTSELKSLILRLVVLALILALVFGISNLWRRATFRYVQDVRRRYQFLLLRRFVVWSLVAIIVAVAFSSELGTLATFAGLLTAGVAVALQNVILSVAGYFFLIGRYGIRAGDRVQICGVTGDVVDIGLVRLHLMEVSDGRGTRPTGRMVVFSNAVIFQPNAGLFKQIPGTKFDWHEITLTLAPEGEYRHVEERLMKAVTTVFADYRENLERQCRSMDRSLSVLPIASLQPESRLRLTQAGVEVVIGYPVELDNSDEIDDRITRGLLDAIESEPRLRLVGSGTPNIQAVTEEQPVG